MAHTTQHAPIHLHQPWLPLRQDTASTFRDSDILLGCSSLKVMQLQMTSGRLLFNILLEQHPFQSLVAAPTQQTTHESGPFNRSLLHNRGHTLIITDAVLSLVLHRGYWLTMDFLHLRLHTPSPPYGMDTRCITALSWSYTPSQNLLSSAYKTTRSPA